MSACYQVPWRMYQQQPGANLNNGSVQNPSNNNGNTNQNPHADEVVYKNDLIYFHFDVVKKPGEGEATCEAMDGEFKIAAIPKDFFNGKTFTNEIILRT